MLSGLIVILANLMTTTKAADDVICLSAVCQYDFVIRRTQTMTYRHTDGKRYDVILNGTDLVVVGNNYRLVAESPDVIGMVVDPSHVITTDGYKT